MTLKEIWRAITQRHRTNPRPERENAPSRANGDAPEVKVGDEFIDMQRPGRFIRVREVRLLWGDGVAVVENVNPTYGGLFRQTTVSLSRLTRPSLYGRVTPP